MGFMVVRSGGGNLTTVILSLARWITYVLIKVANYYSLVNYFAVTAA